MKVSSKGRKQSVGSVSETQKSLQWPRVSTNIKAGGTRAFRTVIAVRVR